MKKILSLIAIASLSFSISFAQTVVPAQKKTVTTTNKVKTTTSNAANTVKKEVKKVESTRKEVKLKADGTPDMRYKVNKTKTVVTGPKKKDGTADMRYKANQAAAKKN
jgi:hypothetical protein